MSLKDTAVKEFKSGVFVYIIVTIFAKIFSLVVGGLIMGVILIGRTIYRAFLTPEEKEYLEKKYELEEREKEHQQLLLRYQKEIELLSKTKKQKLIGE